MKSTIKQIREGKKEDYITKTTGIDYPITDNYGHKQYIENFLKQTFPNEDVNKL